jgi:2-polyprenyl-3-methyl-5-hydroxy-6-metoxy-1,4-benzoquinol methylase
VRPVPDGLPVPPLRLIRSSTGTSSIRWYLDGGALAADSITAILERNGVRVSEIARLLDFGCGCGRVIRRWAGLSAEVHGSDYNRDAVRWCSRRLTFATFGVNGLQPPLAHADDSFDLVYALSVFTHLPEPLLSGWRDELRRVIRPGGWLIVSTHGEAFLPQLSSAQQDEFRQGGTPVIDDRAAGTNRCGVYFSERYIRERFAQGFEVLDVVPQGARGNPPQDLTLLRKR